MYWNTQYFCYKFRVMSEPPEIHNEINIENAVWRSNAWTYSDIPDMHKMNTYDDTHWDTFFSVLKFLTRYITVTFNATQKHIGRHSKKK